MILGHLTIPFNSERIPGTYILYRSLKDTSTILVLFSGLLTDAQLQYTFSSLIEDCNNSKNSKI
ncbi:uncharacterized protein LOC111123247 isoform X2 [Crassostrea virginica]